MLENIPSPWPTAHQSGEDNRTTTDILRSSCDSCTKKKIKCDGEMPECAQCLRRKIECVYSKKRKSGPKRRDELDVLAAAGVPGAGAYHAAQQVAARAAWPVPGFSVAAMPYAVAVPGVPGGAAMTPMPSQPWSVGAAAAAAPTASAISLGAASHLLPAPTPPAAPVAPLLGPLDQQQPGSPSLEQVGPREHELLQSFLSVHNSFVPIVSLDTLRDALAVSPFDAGDRCGGGGDGGGDGDAHRFHARRAVLWGSVAMGAILARDRNAASYMQLQQLAMRGCFDFPCQETASAHLLLVTCWCLYGDAVKVSRYMRFAAQILSELPEVPRDLAASIQFLRLMISCPLGATTGPLGRGGGGSGAAFEELTTFPALPAPNLAGGRLPEKPTPQHRVLQIVGEVITGLGKVLTARGKGLSWDPDNHDPLVRGLVRKMQ
ncbi:unnamed protein product, partial [Phaeothamnion confervicola]